MRPDGSRQRRLARGKAPAISPNSHRVAFARGGRLYSIAPSGRRPRALAHLPDRRPYEFIKVGKPAFSPDGRRIVVSVNIRRSAGPGWHSSRWLAVLPAGGGKPRRLVRGGTDPDWQPRG